MRKKVFSGVLACGLLAVMAAATAYAQLPGTSIRATIPFDFRVRGKLFRAGHYQIKRTGDTPDCLLIFSDNDKHERVVFETSSVQKRQALRRGELVFNRYGDTYFLSEVFTGGERTGRELLPSREERNMKREVASNKTEPETVAVAAF